jgi:hypothetical protein
MIGSLVAIAAWLRRTAFTPPRRTSLCATGWMPSTSTPWPPECTVRAPPSTDRYAGGKAQIRDAGLMRLAARIIDTVRRSVDGLSGPERIVTAIAVALEQIRSDPTRRLMSSSMDTPDVSDLPSSPVLGRLAADLTGITDDDPQAAQWIVRVVLSLAYWPIGDSRLEHQMLQRFVAPAFNA